MLAAVLALYPLVAGLSSMALAQTDPAPTTPVPTPGSSPPAPTSSGATGATVDVVDVVTTEGLVDPILAAFMSDSITAANRGGTCSSGTQTVPCRSIALVWQVDTEGVVVPDVQFAALLEQMATSPVPVYLWIGPTGAQLTGKAALLAAAATGVGMSPGTSIGLDGVTVTAPLLAAGAKRQVPSGLLSDSDATVFGIKPAPTIGDFAVDIPGFETKEVIRDGQTRREPVTLVRFSQLPLVPQLFHSVASPPVAYLLFTIGLALLIFELFTAGVGVAGGVGAGSFVLASYGFAVLPTRPWAVGLLLIAMIAFAIDVQTGVPRFWTASGVVLFVAGSLALYDGVSMSWIALLAGIGGVLLAFLSGMPSMVRTRFATPTIGRDWMIGEVGRAVTDIAPDGVVQIKGAQWRAYTNRATPVDQLDRVRVIGIEGLVLEVEPEEGGARDYRDRSPRDQRGEPRDDADADGTRGATSPPDSIDASS